MSEGALVRVLLYNGRARFELAASHHDHLQCTGCDVLVAVPCVIEPATASAIEPRTGVSIDKHRVVLSGLCPACRPAAPA